MALNFTGMPIPGPHADLNRTPPSVVGHRRHFAGLSGEVEVYVGNTGRPLRYWLWLSDASFSSAEAIEAVIELFHARVGSHGTLKETGNFSRSFENVTFHGFEQQGPVIPDVARTMVLGKETYWTQGWLHFYQNFVGEAAGRR